ncbi:hypothetical protein ACM46_22190 [Chryseobacterium angstadtii]|uniref:Uncharacterized protein n=1 Tax=Chryseobacterium angstadtii TaxID=558151 RepID=A0A0J7HXY5_9FLAO|nr:hypothetical protein [Chryseobacterium angstadtii]KMQ58416.1 hypothetical protein ACM46_22190 [Chryseobacterium angstadtii]
MGFELIDYKNKGFQTSDIFMQLAIYYINEEFKKEQYIFTNKHSLEEYHKSVINGQMAGWFAFLWDLYIANASEEETMIQILQAVKTIIHHKENYISVNELQAIPTADGDFKIFYRKPFQTAELIRILDALIQMLQGTWNDTNYDMDINYRYSID